MVQDVHTELYRQWVWSVRYTVYTELAVIQDAVEMGAKIWPYDRKLKPLLSMWREVGIRKWQLFVGSMIMLKVLRFKKLCCREEASTDSMLGTCLFDLLFLAFVSVQFSHSVLSVSLGPHGLQNSRVPCPSPTPGACSNSCLSSWWYYHRLLYSHTYYDYVFV